MADTPLVLTDADIARAGEGATDAALACAAVIVRRWPRRSRRQEYEADVASAVALAIIAHAKLTAEQGEGQ